MWERKGNEVLKETQKWEKEKITIEVQEKKSPVENRS